MTCWKPGKGLALAALLLWRAPVFNACGVKTCPCAIYFQSPGVVEEGHITLFVIVDGEQMVQDCLHATEQIVTDLDGPNTGVFAAWPLAVVRGVPPRKLEG